MKMVTVSQAKSRLSEFIKSAEAGEQVVIMRGSKPAVLLSPISEEDIILEPEISVEAARRIEKEIEAERKAGTLIRFKSAKEAAAALRRLP